MTKATATCTCHRCGKAFTKTSICYNRADANRWEEWAERTFDLCADCRQAERAEEAARLGAKAAADGLPALTGTPKQITWAEQLRATYINDAAAEFADIMHDIETAAARGEDTAELAAGAARFDGTRAWILTHESRASWWIDNRSSMIYRTMERVYTDHGAEIDASKKG